MMTDEVSDTTRQNWARVIGLMLLLTNFTAMFGFWMRGQFISRNDAAATTANIAASETFVRAGIAAELITIAGVIPLIVGLYVVLKPVGPTLATLALSWRLIENALLAGLAFVSLSAVTLIGGGDYLRALGGAHVSDLVYTLVRVHGSGFQVGFFFLGLGQALFSWLWWKSRYVPRWLAGLGLFASSLMAVMALGIIIWPPLFGLVTMAYMAPMGIYELGLGLWLLARGIRLPRTKSPPPGSTAP